MQLTIITHSCPFPFLSPSACTLPLCIVTLKEIFTSYWSDNWHRDWDVEDSSSTPSFITWFFEAAIITLDSPLVSPSLTYFQYLHFVGQILNNVPLFLLSFSILKHLMNACLYHRQQCLFGQIAKNATFLYNYYILFDSFLPS